jgi:hypothetical protein
MKNWNLDSNLKGAAGELLVAQDLIHRGYFVFSPITYCKAPCDLIALEPTSRELARIEVKTKYDRSEATRRDWKFDVLARYNEADESVTYEPTLAQWFQTRRTTRHRKSEKQPTAIQRYIAEHEGQSKET